MFLVARIDALGAVAGEEILVELEAGHALEDRECRSSSVQPGYTVDSYTTTSPFLSTLPTVSLERSSGVRSGRL